jgi:hypothetical protein
MALQIRRGLQANLPASPADGELLYATDTNILYVGDGGSAQAISGGGISNLVEDTTPQLGGNLDVNGRNIISTNNGNIGIGTSGTGAIFLQSTNRVQVGDGTVGSGNFRIVKNGYSSGFGEGFYLQQYHDTPDSININYTRARGTFDAPTILQNGDDIVDLGFSGYDGTKYTNGAAISATVEGVPVLNHVPTKISFATNNGSTTAVRAELSSLGVWKTNGITALTTNQNLAITANGTGSVGIDGTLFKASTTTMTPLSSEPSGAAGKMAVCDGTTWNGGGDGLQHLMIYINGVWTVVV